MSSAATRGLIRHFVFPNRVSPIRIATCGFDESWSKSDWLRRKRSVAARFSLFRETGCVMASLEGGAS